MPKTQHVLNTRLKAVNLHAESISQIDGPRGALWFEIAVRFTDPIVSLFDQARCALHGCAKVWDVQQHPQVAAVKVITVEAKRQS